MPRLTLTRRPLSKSGTQRLHIWRQYLFPHRCS
jgi:hypothetical protein